MKILHLQTNYKSWEYIENDKRETALTKDAQTQTQRNELRNCKNVYAWKEYTIRFKIASHNALNNNYNFFS